MLLLTDGIIEVNVMIDWQAAEVIRQSAYINSQVACALVELEAMKAINAECIILGVHPKYKEEDIKKILERYEIGTNTVISRLFEIG